MADPLMKKIGAPDFNPDKYVKELARSCVGGQELQQQRTKIQGVAEDTANFLKKNVYENYMQFIETAKEISHLEAEMYQLSHLLTDQRSLLQSLSSTSILGESKTHTLNPDKGESDSDTAEEQRKLKLNSIFEKVESCMSLLDTPDRVLLHEGDILELDSETHTALQRMHAYLFNDCFMLTSWIPNRRGPMRYKFQAVYPISSTAVVNIRDLGSIKQEFKLLVFPDVRVFQCNNIHSKKDWLEKFDTAKKMYLAKQQNQNDQKRESMHEKSVSKTESTESPTSGSYDDNSQYEITSLPDWLIDVAEELDVLIVERHFEKAFSLMESAENSLKTEEFASNAMTHEISLKVAARRKTLTNILIKELQVSPGWTPRGGLRSARKTIGLLNKLKMTTQACDLFLAICSQTIKVHVKSVQLEGTTVTYVKQAGEVFFCTMTDVITEFMAAFPEDKMSALVMWASSELRILMNQMVKQIFTPQASLSSISQCVNSLRQQCLLMREFGLDLCFQLDGSLRNSIMKSLKEYKQSILDCLKSKVVEDKWTPVNMISKAGVTSFLDEMQELGLILAKYVINDTWVDLSSSTIWFAKSILTLQCHGLRMITEDMVPALGESIHAIFKGRLNLSIGNDSSYAQKNFKFLLDTLLPVMLTKYEQEVGFKNENLHELATKYGINVGKSPADSKKKTVSTSVPKYSNEYYL